MDGRASVEILAKISRVLRWALCLGMAALCLAFTASALNAQFLKSLFHRDQQAPAPAPALAPEMAPDTSDGG